jgi:hypothetical protein
VTEDEWRDLLARLDRARAGTGDPPPPRWGATTSDGTWKQRMAVLMDKRMAKRRRLKWETLKQQWIAANYERLMLR